MAWIVELLIWIFGDIILGLLFAFFTYLLGGNNSTISRFIAHILVLSLFLAIVGLFVAVFANDILVQYMLTSVAIIIGWGIVYGTYQGFIAIRKYLKQ